MPASADVATLADDVHSTTLPHRRSSVGIGAGLGFTCSGFSASGGDIGSFSADYGCSSLIHIVPVDFSVGELHLDFVPSLMGGFGARLGVLLGSKFFRVGDRASSPFAMAIRGQAEFGGQTIVVTSCQPRPLSYSAASAQGCPDLPITGSGAGVQAGPAVQASYALTRSVSIEGSLSTGVSIWFGGDSIGGTGYAGYFTAIAGARL